MILRRALPAALAWALAWPAWAQRAPDLLPLASLFAGTAPFEFRVSPDGQRIAWLQRVDGRIALRARRLDDTGIRTWHGRREIRAAPEAETAFWWSRDSRRLLFLQDTNGDENTHLFALDVESEAPPRDLTPQPGVRVGIQALLAADPERVVIRHNGRDPRVFDLMRVHLGTGALEPHAANPGDVTGWWVFGNGAVRGRVRAAGGGARVFELAEGGAWREWLRLEPGEDIRVLGLAAGGETVWALSNRGRDRLALVRVSLADGGETLLYEHPWVDLAGGATDGQGRMRYVWAWPGLQEYRFYDAELEADLRPLLAQPRTLLRFVGFDQRGRFATLYHGTEREGAWYLFDRHTRERFLLAQSRLRREALATTEPVRFHARDGLPISGYLTRPLGPPGPVPLVVRPHGGPWSRDTWGFSALNQFLANRGYAVLQVDFRGSRGYGRRFLDAGIRESGRAMLADLVDGVRFAVARGVADPARVALMGASYGGYQTLAGLVYEPGVFAAGIASVAIADLEGWVRHDLPYWQLSRPFSLRFYGDPDRPEDGRLLRDRSPLNRIAELRAPLLLTHGANDVRVDRSHSDRVAAALAALGRPPELIVFEDEGHALNQTRNWLVFARAVERFLARHLGGRDGGDP